MTERNLGAVLKQLRLDVNAIRRDLVRVRGSRAKTAHGEVTITPVANTPTSQPILFPVGMFAAAPRVALTPATTVPGTQVLGVGIADVTSAGATVWLTRTNTSATTVHWIAVGS